MYREEKYRGKKRKKNHTVKISDTPRLEPKEKKTTEKQTEKGGVPRNSNWQLLVFQKPGLPVELLYNNGFFVGQLFVFYTYCYAFEMWGNKSDQKLELSGAVTARSANGRGRPRQNQEGWAR